MTLVSRSRRRDASPETAPEAAGKWTEATGSGPAPKGCRLQKGLCEA
ncbi:MAG: hypothetical protein LBH06_08240 [Rikenellaceae bacterium]|nr:hypothetical protein [Rikenellaceae bacterium]